MSDKLRSASDRRYYLKHREKRIAYQQEYRGKNREKRLARVKAYGIEHREEIDAKKRIHYLKYPERAKAKSKARIIPLAEHCELCGSSATERHHPDYSKPMIVMHLCGSCHMQLHANIKMEKEVPDGTA